MAYAEHTLVVLGGHFLATDTGGTADIWQCGIRVHKVALGGGPMADPGAYLSAIIGPLSTWFANTSYNLSSGATLDYVKANNIGADGKYIDQTQSHTYFYSSGTPGGRAPTVPNILSLVTTWTTANQRGRASKGRIYLPNNTWPAAASVVVSQTEVDRNNTTATGLLNVIKAPSGGVATAIPAVYSRLDASYHDITGIRTGNILDVQRRRKDAFTEKTTTISWTP